MVASPLSALPSHLATFKIRPELLNAKKYYCLHFRRYFDLIEAV
jgi:hypothetical protein